MRLLIVTGLPATGKSTLAQQLAARYRLPLLAKDVIKEALFDAAGSADPRRSRKLSDASFNMMFAELRQLAAADVDVILEGNFRAGQHEPSLRALPAPRIAQILCRVDEAERLRRISARSGDPARHPGHGDAHVEPDTSNDNFLDLPGERLVLNTGTASIDADEIARRVDVWWNLPAVKSD